MKRLITLTILCFLTSSSWAQVCADINCTPVVYFLDIDGDGVGVDFSETNFLCCCCDEPSEMYVLTAGDSYPADPKRVGAENDPHDGCTFYMACNYDESANRNDNSCVFPDACQSCELDPNGLKIVDGTGGIEVSTFTPCPSGELDCFANVQPCSCDPVSYLDALDNCRELTDEAFCQGDVDGDGICDTNSSGEIVDKCTASATEVEDDCGNCFEPGQGKYFTINGAGITPCPPGTEDCLTADQHCNCQEDIFDECGVCAGSGKPEGYECDGQCTDTNPENGVCDFAEVYGCLNQEACNYDELNTVSTESMCLWDDACGICDGPGIPASACTDPDPNNCFYYPEEYHECDGTPSNDVDGNGIADELDVDGCLDPLACNYRESATRDINDDLCILKDALHVCGGLCQNDIDGDGLCDDDLNGDGEPDDLCTTDSGTVDDCGICNGDKFFTLADGTTPCVPGTPGCTNDANECDCEGSTYDILNSCGGNCLEDADNDGICDLDALGNRADRDICISGNYDMLGNCIEENEIPCTLDVDGDLLCDHDTDNDGLPEDPCPNDSQNIKDECGVCGGSGIPAGDCDCNENQPDVLGVCGGTCSVDADGDGICDDDGNDPCVGVYDECGVCDGTSYFKLANNEPCDPGTPGCVNDVGDCNCSGDVQDVLGVCGGSCTADLDADGICDDIDECIGFYDDCDICNGDGIAAGACDCDGNVLDECGICGGDGIAEDTCDCDGNKPEYGYNCDDECLADTDGDGICDLNEEMPITQVLRYEDGASGFTMNLDPIDLQTALDAFEYRHNLMTENLEALTLTGSTMSVTLEKSITDNGTLDINGLSTFNTNMNLRGSMSLAKDLYISESLTIGGTTLSRSGMVTSNLSVAGDALVDGKLSVGESLFSQGRAEFKNRFDISDNFTAYKVPGASSDTAFAVEASSGDMLMRGDLIASSNLNIDGFSELDRVEVTDHALIDNAAVSDFLRVEGNAELQGSIEVGDGVLLVNALSGNTTVKRDFNVGRNVSVLGNAHVLGTATIGGTTFANGGIETTWLKVKGDMNVEGEGLVRMKMDVGEGINVYKDLTVYSDFEVTGLNNAQSATFLIESATGNTSARGNIDVNTLLVNNSSTLDGSVTVNNDLNTLGEVDYGQNIIVGSADGLEIINFENAVFNSSLTSTSGLTTSGTFTTTDAVTTNNASITGGQLNTGGVTNISATEAGSRLEVVSNIGAEFAAEFQNSNSGGKGILLKSGMVSPAGSNNFAVFKNSKGLVMGRIEGITANDWTSDGDYVYTQQAYSSDKKQSEWALGNAIYGTVLASIDLVTAGFDVGGEATAFTPCFGNGMCVAVPVPSLIALSIANLAIAVTGVAEAAGGVDVARVALTDVNSSWVDYKSAVAGTIVGGSVNVGVTYQSGAGDYAEWLPKEDPKSRFKPGQVVGVRNGFISLDTENSDHVFAISTLPIVLGNVPEKTSGYEKVAFLGQVPVQVLGKVRYGDFIVASGNSDGFATGVNPTALRSSDFSKIIGVALEESQNKGLKKVNVAIGMNNGLSQAAETIERQIIVEEMKTKALKKVAFSLMKGEKPSLVNMQEAGLIPPVIGEMASVGSDSTLDSESSIYDDYVVFEMTDTGLDLAFEQAITLVDFDTLSDSGRAAWETIAESDELRTQFLQELKKQVNYHNKSALKKIANFNGSQKLSYSRPASELLDHEDGSNMNTSNQ